MAVPSNMLPLGTPLPRFSLTDTVSGRLVASDELRGRPSVVAFICNHCPYVKHIRGGLAEFVGVIVGLGGEQGVQQELLQVMLGRLRGREGQRPARTD